MPEQFERVQPGDLITADFMNRLLTALEGLEGRVAALEGATAGAVVITRVSPEPVRVNQRLQVEGRNFGFSTGAHRVFLDTVQVLSFVSGTDERMIFTVPPIPGLPQEGRTVTLSVRNQDVVASRPIVVLPLQLPLEGNLEISFQSGAPITISPGGQATLPYRVFSRVNQTARFPIQATVSGVPNVSAWQDQIQILGQDGAPLDSGSIELGTLREGTVLVRIPSVPTSPSSFTLTVSSIVPGVAVRPDIRSFSVGTPTQAEDPSFSFVPFGAEPPAAHIGGEIRLPAGGQALLTFLAEFTVEGQYNLLPRVVTGTGWTVQIDGGITFLTVTPTDLQTPQSRRRTASFIVSAASSAAAGGSIEFRIQRQGASTARTIQRTLVRL